MTSIFQAAAEFQAFCDSRRWMSCFIGGIAVQRWGEVRVTRDIDLTLITGFGTEGPFVNELLAHYTSRVPDAVSFASTSRVMLLNSPEGIGIDVSLGALPFEESAVQRASLFEFAPGVSLRTCSAEDLLIMKLFAYRPLDLRDAEGIALRNSRHLDWTYVSEQLAPLAEAKEDPSIMATLQRLRSSVGR